MAIYINGMSKEETTNLALAMAYSGDVLDLSDIGEVVDKHSTGGIGDKITLILMPIVASLGVKVAKMSGRGLGATGGTKDKLEAIPGYRTEIEIEEFIENVKKIGISQIGQTLNIAPAEAQYKMPVEAKETGYVQKLNAEEVGKIAMHLGAGRMKKEDNIDYAVGIELIKKVGCYVEKGETIAYIYADDEQKGKEAVSKLQEIYEISAEKVDKPKEILEIIE